MLLAQDLVTVGGLPLHPLLVHAVVVLLPLSAVGGLVIAVRPAWRRRLGLPVALLTVLAVAAVPIAQQSGEQLEHRLVERLGVQNPLIEEHAALGETMLGYALVFGLLMLAFVFTGWQLDRRAGTGTSGGPGSGTGSGTGTDGGTGGDDLDDPPRHGAAPAPDRPLRLLLAVLAVLVVLSGAVATGQLIRVGHSGSQAVWEGIAGT